MSPDTRKRYEDIVELFEKRKKTEPKQSERFDIYVEFFQHLLDTGQELKHT